MMSSLSPSYCKTSARGTPAEHREQLPVESDPCRYPSSCLIPKRFLSRNIPSRNTDAVTSLCQERSERRRSLADLVRRYLNAPRSAIRDFSRVTLVDLCVIEWKITHSRLYSAVHHGTHARTRPSPPGHCCCHDDKTYLHSQCFTGDSHKKDILPHLSFYLDIKETVNYILFRENKACLLFSKKSSFFPSNFGVSYIPDSFCGMYYFGELKE